MKLWLVRHAQTEAVPGLCYGALDVAAPRQATQAVAARVAPLLPPGLALQTSPLSRCAQLADALQARQPVATRCIDPRLAEMDFGRWEGQLWSAIARAEFDAWLGNFGDAPAGVTGESTRRFMQRVGAVLDEVRATGRDTLWVTHAGVMRAVQLLQQGVRFPARANEWPAAPIDFGACWSIDLDGALSPASTPSFSSSSS